MMTEEEYLARAKVFVATLENTPEVGKRPFGYPKFAWVLSGILRMLGMLLGLVFLSAKESANPYVVMGIGGAVLFACGFTMRHVAYFWGWHTTIDRHLGEKIAELEKRLETVEKR